MNLKELKEFIGANSLVEDEVILNKEYDLDHECNGHDECSLYNLPIEHEDSEKCIYDIIENVFGGFSADFSSYDLIDELASSRSDSHILITGDRGNGCFWEEIHDLDNLDRELENACNDEGRKLDAILLKVEWR